IPSMGEVQKIGLAPVANRDARLLILGSLPGEASLKLNRYYGHPRNQFWQLVGNVILRDLTSLDYDDRLDALAQAGIALWDMVSMGRRSGSLDSALRVDRLSDVAALISKLPQLRAIAFNGRKASS